MPSILTSLASAVRALSLLATLVRSGVARPAPRRTTRRPKTRRSKMSEEDAVEEEVEDDWVDPSAGEETEEPEKR
jgi:hypothetical protein